MPPIGINSNLATTTDKGNEDDIPGGIAEKLSIISSHAKADIFDQIVASYVDIRSKYQIKIIQILLRNIDIPVKGGSYLKGSHPFISAIREYFKLAEKEIILANRILPALIAADVSHRTMKHPTDLVHMSSEAIRSKISKGLQRHDFMDQIWIFDTIEAFNDLYTGPPDNEQIRKLVKESIRVITAAGIDFLRQFADYCAAPPGQVTVGGFSPWSSQPTVGVGNATVCEMTSVLLQCLRRMPEYERVIESLLSHWAQEGWDGLLGVLPPSSENQPFSMALYIQDLLRGLEVGLGRQSQLYRRQITGTLFQLNNYNHIVKYLHSSTSSLSSLLTLEMEQKYEGVLASLIEEYLKHWDHLGSLLKDNSDRSSSLSPRDRLKVKDSSCTIPLVTLCTGIRK